MWFKTPVHYVCYNCPFYLPFKLCNRFLFNNIITLEGQINYLLVSSKHVDFKTWSSSRNFKNFRYLTVFELSNLIGRKNSSDSKHVFALTVESYLSLIDHFGFSVGTRMAIRLPLCWHFERFRAFLVIIIKNYSFMS